MVGGASSTSPDEKSPTGAMPALAPDAKNPSPEKKDELDEELLPKLSPKEEAERMREAASCKEEANRLFNLSKYNEAVARYEESLLACPIYLHYELAVLKSNLAACYLKLEQWKEAIKEASSALKSLDKCEHDDSADDEKEKDKSDTSKIEANAISVSETGQSGNDDSDIEEVIVSEGASKAGPAVVTPVADDDKAQDPEAARRKRKEDIKRIRCKSLLRRARARCQVGGWSNLSGAEEDYKAILAITTTMEDSSSLPPAEKRRVERQLCELPPKIKAAQEKETAEMWAKLKDLGNGILKPFGLSTDNFKMQKDENTGGYSLNFSQGGT